MSGREMSKAEAIVALGDLARTAEGDHLRALALGMKCLARAVVHKRRVNASRANRRAECEGRRGMSKPTPEEVVRIDEQWQELKAHEASAGAAVARSVAADMRRMELKCWKGRRMGEGAVALMLDGFASRLEGAYCQKIRKRAQARAAAKDAGEDAQ